MASQFPSGATAGTLQTTGAGDTYIRTDKWELLTEQMVFNPTGDLHTRLNSPRWGNPLVYENVYEAVTDGVMYEYGRAWLNKTTYTGTNYWNGALILDLGSPTVGGNAWSGAQAAVKVPAGYDMVWVRVLNGGNGENHFDMLFDPSSTTGAPSYFADYGGWYAGGMTSSRISPYNSAHATNADEQQHVWLPFHLHSRAGGTAYILGRTHSFSDPGYWVSGLAFTTNLWGYTQFTAISALRNIHNGTVGGTSADSPGWWGQEYGHQFARVAGTGSTNPIISRMTVANVTGGDKVLHVVGFGDNSYRPVPPLFVNGTKVDQIAAAMDPFVMQCHLGNTYLGVRSFYIPAALAYQNNRYMKLEFQTNRLKNDNWFFNNFICCDLNA